MLRLSRGPAAGPCQDRPPIDSRSVANDRPRVGFERPSHEELAGPDVIVAHRLLKNHVRDRIGARPYALLTAAALDALEVPADEMIAMTETYDGQPPIPVHVLPLS